MRRDADDKGVVTPIDVMEFGVPVLVVIIMVVVVLDSSSVGVGSACSGSRSSSRDAAEAVEFR